MKIVYVVNVDTFFLSHRLPLALHALQVGYQVYLLTAFSKCKEVIAEYGITCIEIPFERCGTNPIHEFKCINLLCENYRQIKPDIIHHVSLKACLLGSVAAKLVGCKNVVNALSGLGYNFTNERRGLTQIIIKCMMKVAFKSDSYSFILQNKDDFALINNMNFVQSSNLFLIEGSGIDLEQYKYSLPIKKNKLIILFPARILKDKGIIEYINSANLLLNITKEYARFIIAGSCDIENPSSLKPDDLNKCLIPDYLEWIGFKDDMYEVYKQADIVVLPSYREGLPKSLIEACAVGRPIITTDAPGCKECVVNGENGFIVPVKDYKELSSKILWLLNHPLERIKMGECSRVLAENKFSIKTVVSKTFEIYNKYIRE